MFPNGPPLPFLFTLPSTPRGFSAVNAFRWEIDEKWINYSQFKKKIRHRAEILEENHPGTRRRGHGRRSRRRALARLSGRHRRIPPDPLLKIAVAGSVKSGKKHPHQCVDGEDLLKRGAGIVTAFITRVLTSEGPGGWVELKSWRQINRR